MVDYDDLEWRIATLEDKAAISSIVNYIVLFQCFIDILFILWGMFAWAARPISDFLFNHGVIEYEMYDYLYELQNRW